MDSREAIMLEAGTELLFDFGVPTDIPAATALFRS
jgi:hypothetical protein